MTVHGSARFATFAELNAAGMIGVTGLPDSGLMIGYWFENEHFFRPIVYQGDLHQLIIGGTGGGKFTTAIAPLLLGSGLDEQTVVVVDPKGEIARLAGPFFQKAFADRPSVFLLDPWDECKTGQTSVLNFLSQITPDNPNHVDDARALADAMIMPSGGENTHWDSTGRNFLAALLLYVALDPAEEGNRDLLRVRDLATMPWSMPKSYTGPKRPTLSALLYGCLDSDLAGGAIRRGFSSFLNRADKEQSGILSTIDRDTAWIDSPQMATVLRGDSFDLKEAALSGNKYFVVIPPAFFMTHRAWLRLAVTTFSKAFKRYMPGPDCPADRYWRHIVIDEFANLGEMSFVLGDIAIGRGFAVKYHFAIQDLAQLERVYEKGWQSFINNSFQRVFAVGDLFTAEHVSRLLGSSTAQSESVSTGQTGSRGTSRSVSDGASEGTNLSPGESGRTNTGQSYGQTRSVTESTSDTSGWSESRSFSPVQRALRTPDEVRRLASGNQLLLLRGMHPVECWRPPYWTIFPSLPKYNLTEILGTVGREPVDEAELRYFTSWRNEPLLMRPKKFEPVRALPPPRAKQLRWVRPAIATAACAILLLAYWLWPSAAPPPSPPKPTFAVAAPVQPPSPPVVSAPVQTAPPPPVAQVSPPPAATPPPVVQAPPPPAPVPSKPAIVATAPAVQSVPARPRKARPPVPNEAAMASIGRGIATRDYLLKLMGENMNRCAPGHGQEEEQLMNYLFTSLLHKRIDRSAREPAFPDSVNHARLFDEYLRKPTWTRSEREKVLELITVIFHENFVIPDTVKGTETAFARFYQGGRCPFDTVSESDYLPPVYADAQAMSAQN
jgi:type IV secretion system protein VirD4